MSDPRWANKPWMKETMYTSEADPSHNQGQRSQERTQQDVDDILAGEGTGRVGRLPLHDLGDGRPDASRADNTPMDYRQGSREGYLDLADREEIMPADYVPAEPVRAQAHVPPAQAEAHMLATAVSTPRPSPPPPQQAMPLPQAARAEGTPTPRKGDLFEIVSILPQKGSPTKIVFIFGAQTFSGTVTEIETIAHAMLGAV
jgi:hypothetical protein